MPGGAAALRPADAIRCAIDIERSGVLHASSQTLAARVSRAEGWAGGVSVTTSRANVGLVRSFSAAPKIVTPAAQADEEGAPPISKPLYIACALFFGAYLSYFMVPLVGHGTAKHAVELAKKSTDPMLQKSAADRIALLSGTDSTAEVMVKVGAVAALLGLLATSSDANVLGSTVCALAVLSKCESGKAELVTGASKAGLQQALRAVEKSAVREKLAALIELK